jgi:hypothetical protein
VSLEELTERTLTIPCLATKRGKHLLVIEFYDQQGLYRGGITIPAEVREREPLIGERMMRVMKIGGAVIAAASALVAIVRSLIR